MKQMILPLALMMISTFAKAGEVTTKAHCTAGNVKVDVEMDEIGDNFFDIVAKGVKTSYANNSSDPKHKGPSTVTAVLDENAGVLAVVGLNISDDFTLQETTLVSIPKTYVRKPTKGTAPADATFNATLTGPMTGNLNLVVKCALHSAI